MDWKAKERASRAGGKATLSFAGGGKIAVPVASIVSSPRVQRHVNAVKEIADSVKRNSGR